MEPKGKKKQEKETAHNKSSEFQTVAIKALTSFSTSFHWGNRYKWSIHELDSLMSSDNRRHELVDEHTLNKREASERMRSK